MFRCLVLAVIIACSSAKPTAAPPTHVAPPATTPVPPNTTSVAPNTPYSFALADLTFSVRGRDIARLRGDGTIEAKTSPSAGFVARGVMAADGSLTTDGTVVVKRGVDGAFHASDGTLLFTLVDDALVIEELRVTVADTGVMVGMPDDTRVTGASDAATRRTALLVLGLLVELSNQPGQHGLKQRKPRVTP